MPISTFKIRNELLIIAFCTLISSVAPIILIGAIYSSEFTILGLLFSVTSFLLFEITMIFGRVVHKLFDKNKLFQVLIVVVLGFLPYAILFIFRLDSVAVLIQLFWIQNFSPLSNLTVIILGFLLLTKLLYNKCSDIYCSMLIVTMNYLIPIFITFLLVPYWPNSEGKVLLENVTIMYLIVKSIYFHTTNQFKKNCDTI
jgi:hypothetical protein